MKDANEPKWAAGLPKPPAWRNDGEETLFQNPWLRLTRHPATAPTGQTMAVQPVAPILSWALPIRKPSMSLILISFNIRLLLTQGRP